MCQQPDNFVIRPITPSDMDFLWRMAYYSAHMEDEPGTSIDSVRQHDEVSKYVRGWGNPEDIGVIAIDGATNQPAGAAWVRLLTGDEKAYGWIDDQTPEMIVALEPQYRGKGLGTRLLTELFRMADSRFSTISLNVRSDNRAKDLYSRFGFRQFGAPIVNRVGTQSLIMIRRID